MEAPAAHDPRYEWKIVLLLSIGFGLVGLDRFMILPLFPVIAQELNLGYQDLGLISGTLAIAWGITSIVTGRLADRVGARKVLIPSILIFSLLAGVTGLATGIIGLVICRMIMGAAEGGFAPTSITATVDASRPSRIGLNIGRQQNMFSILGLGLGPIIVTQLYGVLPSWRWVFFLVSIPGFVVGILLMCVLRNNPRVGVAGEAAAGPRPKWSALLGFRNVLLAMLIMFCALTSLFVINAMVPTYLVDFMHLDLQTVGVIMSAIGFGGFAGQFVMPALSDRIGRKTVILMCFAGSAICLLGLIETAAEPAILFAGLFGVAFFNFSLACLTVGPLTTELVPPLLMGTATGFVIGAGEIFGGGIAPAFAGFVAQNYGIQHTLELALVGLCVGFAIALGLRETVVRRSAGGLSLTAAPP